MMSDVRRGASVAVHVDSKGEVEPQLHVRQKLLFNLCSAKFSKLLTFYNIILLQILTKDNYATFNLKNKKVVLCLCGCVR